MTARLGVLVTCLAMVCSGLLATPAAAARRPNLPSYISLGSSVTQLVTVTSDHWSDRRASLRVWRKRDGRWHLVRGPFRVRLGYHGWVRSQKRRQNTGTTPAGRFSIRSAFGNRADPGAHLKYTHVDGNDVWPYEPHDPATYNIYQPHKARGSHWRSDYMERLSHYTREYAYALVIGFNLPGGVHWSPGRKQYVARTHADTRRGGGIFLHVQQHKYTAGCVAGPLGDIRWLVRWLDPRRSPRIVMGPTAWVKRRF